MPCPVCNRLPDVHPASACLDAWVHTQFLGAAPPQPPGEIPAYSAAVAGDPILDAVIEHPGWPDGARCGVHHGAWVVDTDAERLAADNSLALAICRAAVMVPAGGTRRLEVRTHIIN